MFCHAPFQNENVFVSFFSGMCVSSGLSKSIQNLHILKQHQIVSEKLAVTQQSVTKCELEKSCGVDKVQYLVLNLVEVGSALSASDQLLYFSSSVVYLLFGVSRLRTVVGTENCQQTLLWFLGNFQLSNEQQYIGVMMSCLERGMIN